ncbi:MAG: ABC transporter ATP-binding protein, partial [Candidatus Rokuibacteriota bacterium]
MLSVEDLSINFGGLAALSGFSVEVAEREIFALIGPNGAGKSTVFNIVTGLYRPSTGRVRFLGRDLLALAPHGIARLGVARTFQNTEVFRRLSALDNVLIGRHAHLHGGVVRGALGFASVGREEARARELAHELLARLGLDGVAGVEAGSLPLGLQK